MNTLDIIGYGAKGGLIGGKKIEPLTIHRKSPSSKEVMIEILYCGVCHSDIHQVNNDWKNTIYPCVPGHEIVGRVVEIGSEVKNHKLDDIVGVGCMIDSCGECNSCKAGDEQFCKGPVGMTMTYNGHWKPDGSGFNTFGGFSSAIVVQEDFVLKIPAGLDPAVASPILCAGVTTYSPMKARGIKEGDKVGIIGIGGLGHMAVMIARAMGAEVTAITTKESKRVAATELGAQQVLISTSEEDMKKYENYFDFMLCTIPEPFDVNPYITLLGNRGLIVTVGLLGEYKKVIDNMEMAKLSRSMGASIIGSIAETQEVLEFCATHGIAPQVQMIPIQKVNEAFEHITKEEVKFRYVIDMRSIEKMADAGL